MDTLEEEKEVPCDAVVDVASGWKRIESLLKETPNLERTPERNGASLEQLFAGRDAGQPEKWVGRQEELERLDVWWRSGLPVAWVEGQAGLGKSGLIRTWIAAFNELGYESEGACVSGYISGLDVERGSTELERWVRKHPGERLLLMIDGFDEAQDPELALNFTERAINASVRILVSSRSAIPTRLASIGTRLTLAEFAASSGEEILRNAGVEGQISARLLQRYGGSPLILSMIARALTDGTATVEDLVSIDGTASGLGQLLTRKVATLSPDARRLLQCLAVDQPSHGLAHDSHIRNAAATSEALEELLRAGLVSETEGGPVIFHAAIRDWVRNEFAKGCA